MLIHLRDAAAGVGDAEQELFQLLSDRNPYRAARVGANLVPLRVEVSESVSAGNYIITDNT